MMMMMMYFLKVIYYAIYQKHNMKTSTNTCMKNLTEQASKSSSDMMLYDVESDDMIIYLDKFKHQAQGGRHASQAGKDINGLWYHQTVNRKHNRGIQRIIIFVNCWIITIFNIFILSKSDISTQMVRLNDMS